MQSEKDSLVWAQECPGIGRGLEGDWNPSFPGVSGGVWWVSVCERRQGKDGEKKLPGFRAAANVSVELRGRAGGGGPAQGFTEQESGPLQWKLGGLERWQMTEPKGPLSPPSPGPSVGSAPHTCLVRVIF